MRADNGVQAQAGNNGFLLAGREHIQPLLQCSLVFTIGEPRHRPTRLAFGNGNRVVRPGAISGHTAGIDDLRYTGICRRTEQMLTAIEVNPAHLLTPAPLRPEARTQHYKGEMDDTIHAAQVLDKPRIADVQRQVMQVWMLHCGCPTIQCDDPVDIGPGEQGGKQSCRRMSRRASDQHLHQWG